MHAGAEGTSALHLTGQDEIYGGENRGNPEAFARMAIDAGADLIIGYSPHVLRAMEIYHHRLIAYSLGNFAGYHNFTLDGDLGMSGILRVEAGRRRPLRERPLRLDQAGRPRSARARSERPGRGSDRAALARGPRRPRRPHLGRAAASHS